MNKREIKFRAWDKQREVMLGSDYPKNWEGLKDEFYDDMFKLRLCSIEPLNNDPRFILMQFTGFTDENGTDVYEGDVVDVEYDYSEKKYTFGKGYKRTIRRLIRWKNTGDTYGFNLLKNKFKVIGNIYENPDLLKGNL